VLLPRDHKLLQQQVRMCGYEGVRMSGGEGVRMSGCGCEDGGGEGGGGEGGGGEDVAPYCTQ